MKKGYWVIRTYTAGRVIEKTKYWVPGEKPTRSKRKMKSDIKKQQHNGTCAVREVARLLNANFTRGDIFLGLDYSETGEEKIRRSLKNANEENAEYSAAEHELKLFIRRVSRECKAKNIRFDYVAITSDMNGETGESVRVHHHLVINKEAFEICQKKWSLGGVHFERLSGQADYTPIAEYLLRQVRHIPDAKKYVSSRGLTRPVPKDRIAAGNAELRPARGCVLVFRSEFRPDIPQYIRFIKQEEQKKEAEAYEHIQENEGHQTDL